MIRSVRYIGRVVLRGDLFGRKITIYREVCRSEDLLHRGIRRATGLSVLGSLLSQEELANAASFTYL